LPQRHEGTKNLFNNYFPSCLSALVAMKKSFATKYIKIMTKVLTTQLLNNPGKKGFRNK